MAARRSIAAALAFAVVTLTALNLRAGIASVAPVLGDISAAFGVGPAIAGTLTALPGLCFALMGWAAVPIARRFGLSTTLLGGAVALVVGLAARPWVSSFAPFVALTLLVVGGIAVTNILLPAWIKTYGTARTVVALMTTYTTVLGVSSALGPMSTHLGGWQMSLFVWAIPVVLQVVGWLIACKHTGVDPVQSPDTAAIPMRRSRTAVALLFFFGLQSTMAYAQMGWLPTMLESRGISASRASLALALIGAINVVGGLIMPVLIERLRDLRPVPLILSAATLAGWLGVLVNASAAPLTWATLMGIGGMCFPLALALIAARTRQPEVTARLSGFVQPGGYILAGVFPFLFGVLAQATGGWEVPLGVLIALTLAMAVAGVAAARSVYIDDELLSK